jgi:O-antigen/teichoic acid export membrane protein
VERGQRQANEFVGHMADLAETLDSSRSRKQGESNHLIVGLLSLLGDSAQYLVGLAFIGLANMVLLPLYTRYLGPSNFGLYALIDVLVLTLISVSGLGFAVSYLKLFASARPGEVPELLGTMIWANGFAGAAAGIALWILFASKQATRMLGGDASRFAWLLLPLILLETLQGALLTHLRAQRRPTSFSLASAFRLISIAAISLWLVAGRGEGLSGVFKARVLGDLCGFLVMGVLTASDLSLSASYRTAASMAKYGMPVMASSLTIMILDGAGRFFLNHYGNLEQVGLYAVAAKISGVMRTLVVVPFGAAWGGLMFQLAKRSEAQAMYSKIMSYLLVLSMSLALVFSLFSPFLLLVLATRDYAGSLPVIPWLFLVQAAAVLQYPCSMGIYLGSATKWLPPVFLSGVVVSLVLNWLLTPRLGTLGAAWAWLGAYVWIITLMAWIGQRYYPLRYEKKALLLASLPCLLAVAASRFVRLSIGGRGILFPFIFSTITMACAIGYVWNDLRHLDGAMGNGLAE